MLVAGLSQLPLVIGHVILIDGRRIVLVAGVSQLPLIIGHAILIDGRRIVLVAGVSQLPLIIGHAILIDGRRIVLVAILSQLTLIIGHVVLIDGRRIVLVTGFSQLLCRASGFSCLGIARPEDHGRPNRLNEACGAHALSCAAPPCEKLETHMKTDCWFCIPCKRGMQNLCSPGAAHGPSKPTVTKPLAELGGKIAVPRQKWALLPQHATCKWKWAHGTRPRMPIWSASGALGMDNIARPQTTK